MVLSVIGRNSQTGEIGVAALSPTFAIGSTCTFIDGGIGAVATQGIVNPLYGIEGLTLLRRRVRSRDIVQQLILEDDGRDFRQVHIVDGSGNFAQHTGKQTMPWAGHLQIEDASFAGNYLMGGDVLEAARDAWVNKSGNLAERLLTSLGAANAAGGDLRGARSAVILTCSHDPYPDLDIRVDDNDDPITELGRLLEVSKDRYQAFRRMLPGRNSKTGIFDRAEIEREIEKDRERRHQTA